MSPVPERRAFPPPADGESPFASVRELWAMEQRFLTALTTQLSQTEQRLTAVVKESDSRHERTHEQMVRVGADRHKAIDDFIKVLKQEDEQEAIERAKRAGSIRVLTGSWKVLAILDTHWRIIALIITFLLLVLGNVHIEGRAS